MWVTITSFIFIISDNENIFKAAQINIFISTVDQMSQCKVKDDIRSDNLTENYHNTLHSSQLYCSVLVTFSLLFWFYAPQLYCFGSFLPLSSTCFSKTHWQTHTTLPRPAPSTGTGDTNSSAHIPEGPLIIGPPMYINAGQCEHIHTCWQPLWYQQNKHFFLF